MLKYFFTLLFLLVLSVPSAPAADRGKNLQNSAFKEIARETIVPAQTSAIQAAQASDNGGGPLTPASVGTYTSLQGRWDWQSNGGSIREIEVDSLTGNIHVVLLSSISPDSAGQSSGRRTLYARSTNDGATWDNFSNLEVPAVRSGYPTLALLQGTTAPGSTLIANHSGAPTASFAYVEESTPGVFTELPGTPALNPPQDGGEPIWPWITGSADGSVIIHSSVSPPEAAPSAHFNFINRTTDLINWQDPWTEVPLNDASARAAIRSTATGRVGVMVSAVVDTVLLVESTDNGSTWPNTTIVHPPFRLVGPDTMVTYVGWDFIYDGAENPQVALGSTIKSPAGGALFRGSRIVFWSAATGYVDATPYDTVTWPSTMVVSSNHLPVGWPSIARSGSRIVIAFTGLAADDANLDSITGRIMGDIYMVQSTDNGFTWSPLKNITKTPQMDERYPSISKYNPAGYAYMTWVEDPRAGTNIPIGTDNTPESPMTVAKQVFLKADLSNIFVANDMTTLSVDAPPTGDPIKQGTSFIPKATFKNIGLASQTSVTVRFEVLNSVPAVVYTNDKTIASIAPTATQQVTFDPVPGTLTTGVYTTRATVLLAGDQDLSNDIVSSNTQIIPVVTVAAGGYSVDFESPAPEGGFTGWHTAVVGGGTSDWALGTPAKFQISHAHSGVNAWVTKLTGNYSNNKIEYVGSPVLDLTAIPGNIAVEFWQNFNWEHDWDGGVLQYSTDGGTTWDVADHVLGAGAEWNTSNSTGWYNSGADSGGIGGVTGTNGVYTPPYWTDSSVIYPSNTDGWIRSTTVLPIGGLSDVRLRWISEQDAASTREGWAIDDVSITSAATTVGVPVTAGWNMVSNPVNAVDQSVSVLYPTSAFAYGFRFDPATGYQQSTTMSNGPGYWVKSGSATTANISGGPINSYEVSVVAGWNMVGSISSLVDTSTITSTPGGLKASDWFGFTGSYTASPQIIPGKAFWVKSYGTGKFFFENITAPASRPQARGVSLADNFSSITIRDAKGGSQTLYFGSSEDKDLAATHELPPVPPSGAFDARFDGSLMLKTYGQSEENISLPISIQAVAYPLEVTWNIKNGSREYVIVDGFGGVAVAPKTMSSIGSLKITNSAVNRLVIRTTSSSEIPAEYALLQNYPNPFNPSTNVKFALPLQSLVNVEIYNVLGQRVRTLVNGDFVAGYHVVEWNGKNDAGQQLSSGVYMLKIAATNVDGRSFSDVQKLMMLK